MHLIPDHSQYATKNDLAAATANHTFDYLPRSGGQLTGSFTFNKTVYDQPALDFSTDPTSGHQAFKFAAISAMRACVLLYVWYDTEVLGVRLGLCVTRRLLLDL